MSRFWTRSGRVLVACGLAACCTLAGAATFKVSEIGTVVSDPVINMRWRQPSPGRGDDQTVEGSVRVDLRLNLEPWLNRPARLFMVMAPSETGRIVTRWTSQGRLLPGTVASGERAVIFDGIAGPAVLTESLLLTFEADGQRLDRRQTLNFHFEIEVSP